MRPRSGTDGAGDGRNRTETACSRFESTTAGRNCRQSLQALYTPARARDGGGAAQMNVTTTQPEGSPKGDVGIRFLRRVAGAPARTNSPPTQSLRAWKTGGKCGTDGRWNPFFGFSSSLPVEGDHLHQLSRVSHRKGRRAGFQPAEHSPAYAGGRRLLWEIRRGGAPLRGEAAVPALCAVPLCLSLQGVVEAVGEAIDVAVVGKLQSVVDGSRGLMPGSRARGLSWQREMSCSE